MAQAIEKQIELVKKAEVSIEKKEKQCEKEEEELEKLLEELSMYESKASTMSMGEIDLHIQDRQQKLVYRKTNLEERQQDLMKREEKAKKEFENIKRAKEEYQSQIDELKLSMEKKDSVARLRAELIIKEKEVEALSEACQQEQLELARLAEEVHIGGQKLAQDKENLEKCKKQLEDEEKDLKVQ